MDKEYARLSPIGVFIADPICQSRGMDLPMRIIVALSIIAGGVAIAVPVLIVTAKRRRADKLRRRGIKSYNRTPGPSRKG